MRVCRSRQDLTFQYPCSPLSKGGEGQGEGGFETYRIYKLCLGDWYYSSPISRAGSLLAFNCSLSWGAVCVR
jgi:hypothetical protein